MLSEVLTRANSVALKLTEPSEFKGMFIATKRWNIMQLKVVKLLYKSMVSVCPLQFKSKQGGIEVDGTVGI